VLTDFGGTFVFAIVLAFFYAMSLAASGMPQEQIELAIRSTDTDTWYFWVATIGGAGCSVAGGYVCARVARQSEYTLGVILAVISSVLGLLIGSGGEEMGMSIVLHAASVASVIFGAWLGKKRNRRPAS
jgi:hypothetical protein